MDLSYIFWALVLGFVAGLLARALVPGKDRMGIVATTLLGIAGALVGSTLFGLVGIGDTDALDWGGILGAIIGAVIVLALFNAVTGRKKRDRDRGRGVGHPAAR